MKFPTVRKEVSYDVVATHDLTGITSHEDGKRGEHSHCWTITCIFIQEYNPIVGFQRDEVAVDSSWGARIAELAGKNLSTMMALPATAENIACWLLFNWLVNLSAEKVNFELTGVRVTKNGRSSEITRNDANRSGWLAFGGEAG